MIGRITGQLAERTPPNVLIDVKGIGYEIQMPMSCFYLLPETNEQVTLYTHFVVREDAQLLFGFTDKTSRELFRELIKANGVGPKLGLTILSGMSATQVLTSVQQEDVSALVTLPGVGKKTAERLVVELKDRLAKFVTASDAPMPEVAHGNLPLKNSNDAKHEATDALVALGYKPAQAEKMVKMVMKPDSTSESLIRDALKSSM